MLRLSPSLPRAGRVSIRATLPAVLALFAAPSLAAAPQTPEVSFEAASSTVGEADAAHQVRVLLSEVGASDVTIEYTVSGTASGGGVDYTETTASPLVISVGSLEGLIDLTVVDDALDELDETVILTLGNITGGTAGATLEHTVSLTDDDDSPTVEFQAATGSAGEATGPVTIDVTLSAVSGLDVTVPFTVSGTATDIDDFSLDASPLVIPAGGATGTLTLVPVDDVLDEPAETIVLDLGAPTNATLGSTVQHTTTLADDDTPPTVEFAISTQTLSEGSGTTGISVDLSAPSGQDVSVPFTVSGTATDPDDFGVSASPLVIPAGQVSAEVALTLVSDSAYENSENVVLTLGAPTHASLGAVTVHTATIADDDGPPIVSFDLASQTVSEAGGTVQIDVSLSDVSGLDVTVPFTVAGSAIEGTDFDVDSSPLVIPAGSTGGQIGVTLTGDALHEDSETVELLIGTPTNGTAGSPDTHVLTIDDDDDPPTVSFASASGTSGELGGVVAVTIDLSAASGKEVSLPFTVSGTASEGDDYEILDASPVVIPAGTQSIDLSLSIIDDALFELPELVQIDLGTPDGATLGSVTQYVHTITSEDGPPTIEFLAAGSTAAEGTGQTTATVQLSTVSGADVSVDLLFGGTADRPADYDVSSTTVLLPAGATSADVLIDLVADPIHEGPEVATLQLDSPSGADLGAQITHDLSITDDDPEPTIRFAVRRHYVFESDAPLGLEVLVDGETALDVTVPFSWSGEAGFGSDYQISASPLVIPAGQSSGVIVFTPLDDAEDEELFERVTVRMEPPLTNGTKGAPSATRIFLEDDDGPGFDDTIGGLRPDVTGLEFSQGRVDEVGETLRVTFTNTQDIAITFKKLAFDGESADSFEVSYPVAPPVALAPGDQVEVDITLLPTASGLLRAVGRAVQTPSGAPPGQVDLSAVALGPTGADVVFNVGEEEYVDLGGEVWLADYGSVGTSAYLLYNGGIAGTQDDPLYQSARVGASFGYSLEVPDGSYDLVLHFAEIEANVAGDRVFDVLVENQTLLDDVDLFVTAGSFAAYVTTPIRVEVQDGSFDLDIVASAGEGLLSAFELRSVPLLQQDASFFDYGIVEQGFQVENVLTVTNTGLHDGHASQLAFVIDGNSQGTAEDFFVRIDGVDYYGGVSTVYHAIDFELPAGSAVPISIFFEPTEHQDNEFRIEFTGNFDTLSLDIVGTGGADAGWGFLHPVADWVPALVVDYDEDLVEEVLIVATESHTHEPGVLLDTYEWKVDGVPVSTKIGDRIDLPLGLSELSLTITDDKAQPDSATDTYDLRVHHIDGVPGILASYYDASVVNGGANALLDSLPGRAGFIERISDFFLDQEDGFIGSSFLASDTMVRFSGAFQVPVAPAVYEFVPTGGTETRVRVDGAVVNGPVTIVKKGRHDIDIRFAVATVADMPLSVDVFVDGVEQSNFAASLLHSERDIVPVIHEMPTLGTELGGNLIPIDGFGFYPKDQVVVHWGDTDILSNQFGSWTGERIEFLSPPGTGTIQVTVETPYGVSNIREFTYSPDGPVPVDFNRLDDREVGVYQATSATWHPNGKLYVGALSGKIFEVTFDENWYTTSIVEYPGISGLENFDLLGIAVSPYDPVDPVRLYVAHGEHFLNGGGTFSGPSPYTGQISVLEGPNFNSPIPLVTGLPTSNHDHGVNGMIFDNNGDLLFGVGGNTNAGVKWPLIGDLDESPLSAAIVRAKTSLGSAFDGAVTYVDRTTGAPSMDQVDGENAVIDSGDVDVYASGMRNSVDLVLTTWGFMYASDNGPNYNYGFASTGPDSDTGYHVYSDDELMLLEQDNYYGHPNRARGKDDPRQNVYRDVNEPSDAEFTQRLVGVASSTNGMEEYRSSTFNSQIRGFLLAQKWNDQQFLVELTENRRAVKSSNKLNPYTKGLDVLLGPGGAILVVDYSGAVVRIMEPDDAAAVGLTVYDIFPWRVPETGGVPFVIGGDNFDSGSTPTVTIGGVSATVTSFSKRRIHGVFPALPRNNIGSLHDVAVTIGADTVVYEEAVLALPSTPGNMNGFWRDAAPVTESIGEVAGALVDARIYHFGEGSPNTFSYDPINDGWFDGLAVRPHVGDHHTCEVIGDKIYVIGGFNGGSEGKVQIYDTVNDSWSLGASMPWAGGSCNSAVIDGLIYVCGGIVGSSTVNNLSVYDPVADAWDSGGASLTPMPTGVNHAASVSDGEKLWVFGGRGGGNWPQPGFDTVQCYDPVTNTWDSSDQAQSQLEPMPGGRGGTGKAVWFQDELWIFGGEDQNQVFDNVFAYDPSSNTWREDEPMPTARHGFYPIEFKGRIHLAGGGVVQGFSQSDIVEVFQKN